MSIAIGVFFIPDLLALIKKTPYQLLDPNMRVRNELWMNWFFQFLGWALVYVIFVSGRGFLRDSKKSSIK